MDYAGVVRRVGERLGWADEGQSEEAVRVTLEWLGRALGSADRSALTGALPWWIRDALTREPPAPGLDREGLVRGVAEDLVVPVGEAVEQARTALGEVAAALEPEPLARLRRHLPASVSELLEPAPADPARATRHVRRPSRAPDSTQRMAEGKPGGRRPVSEARPEPQSGSVVRDENPHGEHKLSSASSAPARPDDEALAGGRPGSRQPLSGEE